MGEIDRWFLGERRGVSPTWPTHVGVTPRRSPENTCNRERTVSFRWSAPLFLLLASLVIVHGQTSTPAKQTDTGDLELVERLLVARRDYQKTLILLRAHYLK